MNTDGEVTLAQEEDEKTLVLLNEGGENTESLENTDEDFKSLNIPEEKEEAVILFLKSKKFKDWLQENKEDLKSQENDDEIGNKLMTTGNDTGVINKYNEALPQSSKNKIWFNAEKDEDWPKIKQIIIKYVKKKAQE